MNSSLPELVVAVVSYVTDHGGYVTKTKLLKLLYLFDVEFYRVTGRTFTQFQWKYFHLGPWTAEFDPLLASLVTTGELFEQLSKRPEVDARFLHAGQRVELRKPLGTYKEEVILKSVLDNWGASSTGEILDYVYFRTEPMEYGVRSEPLDFSKITERLPSVYKRTRSSKTPGQIKSLRRQFNEKLKTRPSTPPVQFTAPRYDEEFHAAIEKLDAGEL